LSDVVLSETDQAALRFVLAAEPVAGKPLPACDVLERLAALVRCDSIGAAITDEEGYVVAEVELRAGHIAMTDGPGCDGLLRIAVTRGTGFLGITEHSRADGLSDSLAVAFRNGSDRVVQLWWGRRTGEFSARDVAVLTMIAPAMQRLVRDAATLPASLTVQERRTLTLVAGGCSNSEIARRMGVATCTVRKHLEHAYRKLGVTNRLAAVVALRGEMLPPSELRDTHSRGD